MKNITLSADERLIRMAREKARKEHTTLNREFRRWLAGYAGQNQQARQAEETMRELRGKLRVGRKLAREEMNER
ncbi:MAG: hypothetical protein V5B78_05220 [Desulfohalobiaceae bacterium]